MSARSLASDLRAAGRRALAALRAVPAWLGGIITAIQGLALSYVALLAPTLAVAAAAPAEGIVAADWTGAFSVTTQLWLLGHGAPTQVAGIAITLIPLGLTFLNAAILAAVARRFAARTWGSWGLATATYATGVGIVTAITSPDGAAVPSAIVIAALIAGVAVAVGIWRAHGATFDWLTSIPDWLRVGVRRGSATFALILTAAAVTGAVWAIAGRHAIGDTATALELDTVSAGVLAIAETAYVPTLVVWMMAWLSGQGFAVGLGTAYSPSAIATDALPSLPLLGALPSDAGGWLTWAPAVIVLAALAVRLAIPRHKLDWRMDLAADGVAAGVVATAAAVAFVATSGAIGPGRLTTVGADPVAATVAVLGLTALGLALATAADRGVLALTAPPAKVTPPENYARASAEFKGE